MIKNEGVYTAKCPECSRSILMHVASDGSVSPKECKECHMNFAGIENGVERNTFVVVVKGAGGKFSEANKETKEVGEKLFETILPIKKAGEKSLDTFSLSKKSGKKSFKW